MTEQDQSREATEPFDDDHSPTTRFPSTNSIQPSDSLLTRIPSSIPETRNEPESFDASIPTRNPAASTDDYVPNPNTRHEVLPDTFPGYTVLGKIDKDAMGIVYKAQQEGLNRFVALKVILGGQTATPKDLIRFLAESVASICHPNVVQVHEYGEAGGQPFLAMEYLPGGTLADRLGQKGRLAPKPAAKLLAKLARAVQAAHDQGIVHRDLKPGNVLFDAEDEPKVTDFGLAKRSKGSDTHNEAVMGTPAYMSPEQAQGKSKFVGPQADVYALGVILYECLTGTRPFVHEDTDALLCRVMLDDPEPPSRLVSGLPRDLELITLNCLAKDPADRYPTARALADDLAHFAAGEPIALRHAGTIERALKWARRNPTQAAAYALSLAVVILLAFGASLAVLWWQAEGARAEVEIARDNLARVEYGRTMQVAHQEWRDNNLTATLALLAGTRSDLRGWEWKYLNRLCHGELLELKGHTDPVTSAEWSPDGSRIVTASWDGTARVWDASTGAVAITLKGHTKIVTSAAWSPNGLRVATASDDKTARVWDAGTGAEIRILKGHTGLVTSVTWSPDGSRIVTASWDKTARIWDSRRPAELYAVGRR